MDHEPSVEFSVGERLLEGIEHQVGGALSAGGYAVEQARRAADNVFREAAQAVTRAREELERAWRRYTPRIEVRFEFKLYPARHSAQIAKNCGIAVCPVP